jgi:outer membrane immunogenic protein
VVRTRPVPQIERTAARRRVDIRTRKEHDMKKLALALAAALATITTPALAQDTEDFSGAKATVITGYDVVDLNTPGVRNPDGVIYGFGLGYDVQKGSTVFGVEAEVADSTAKLKAGAATVAETSRDLYIGGRVGVVTGKTLVYAKAGYSNFRLLSIAGNGNADGFRVGAGVEQKLSDKVFAKVEYRYTDYEAGVSRHQGVAGIGLRF